MGHAVVSSEKRVFIRPEWMSASSQFTQLLAQRAAWCGVKIGPELADMVGTAQYMPDQEEVELNSRTLFPGVKPESFDLEDEIWLRANMAGMGAFYHETGHVLFSSFTPLSMMEWKDQDGVGFTKREIDVVIAMEESRVEKQLINIQPHTAPFLQKMSMDIVLKEFHIAGNKYGTSIGALLSLAREDAGSLDSANAAIMRAEILKQIDEKTLNKLRSIWMDYQRIATAKDSNGYAIRTMPFYKARSLAREWIALVVDIEEEKALEDLASEFIRELVKQLMIAGGEPSEEGNPQEGAEGEPSPLSQALAEAAAEIENAQEDETDEEVSKMKKQRAKDEREFEAMKDKENKRMHQSVYGATNSNNGVRWIERDPSDQERKDATEFAKKLAKITVQEHIKTEYQSRKPPGRFIGRQAMAQSSQISRQVAVTATPFRGTKRLHAETDKVRIAVLADVSGSMSDAMEPSASLVYSLSRGAQVADSITTTILFGDQSKAISKGQVKKVLVADANGGGEALYSAVCAADEELNLLDGDGARIVIIVSDGMIRSQDKRPTMKWLQVAKKRGVKVIWVNFQPKDTWYDRYGDTGNVEDNLGYGEKVRVLRDQNGTKILGDKVLEIVKKNHRYVEEN
jgi:hypothetical protein